MQPKTWANAISTVEHEAPIETIDRPRTFIVRGRGRRNKAASLVRTSTPINAQTKGQGLAIAIAT